MGNEEKIEEDEQPTGIKPLAFKTAMDGIDFYVYVKQFLRVAGKIEEAHDLALKGMVDEAKFEETLDYYQKEKQILIGKMWDIISKARKV